MKARWHPRTVFGQYVRTYKFTSPQALNFWSLSRGGFGDDNRRASMANDPYFDRYVYRVGEWRWRFVAANGRTIADSGEGYQTLGDCDHAIAVLRERRH